MIRPQILQTFLFTFKKVFFIKCKAKSKAPYYVPFRPEFRPNVRAQSLKTINFEVLFNDTKPLLIVYHNKLLSWRSYLNCKYTCISENFAEVMLLHFPKIAPFIHESCTFIRKRSFYLINIAFKSSVISFDTKMQIYFEYFNEALVLLIMFG